MTLEKEINGTIGLFKSFEHEKHSLRMKKILQQFDEVQITKVDFSFTGMFKPN
jgi:hypothetical protein